MANAIIAPIAPKSITVEGNAMLQFGANVPEAAKPYGAVSASRPDFGGLTEAAFHLAGLVRRGTDKAAPEAIRDGKGGGLKLWRLIVGPSAFNNWSKLGRIDGNGITPKGLNELSDRTNAASRNSYSTSVERVKLIANVIRNGGTLKLEKGGQKLVKFGAPVTLTVPAKPTTAKKTRAAKPTTAKAKTAKQRVTITPAPKK